MGPFNPKKYFGENTPANQSNPPSSLYFNEYYFYQSTLLKRMAYTLQAFDRLYLFIMRSLYTYDIPGANPAIRYYSKQLIRYKHEEEIERFANKSKRIIDWYVPIPRHVEPVDKETFPMNTTLFDPKLSKSGMHNLASSRTLPEVTKKVTDGEVRLSNSSILTQSGISSLESKNLDNSPYFPHKYRDYDREYPNKWTGKRDWQGNHIQKIDLPAVSSQYYPKWC